MTELTTKLFKMTVSLQTVGTAMKNLWDMDGIGNGKLRTKAERDALRSVFPNSTELRQLWSSRLPVSAIHLLRLKRRACNRFIKSNHNYTKYSKRLKLL
jgi:hypothetical protein